MYSRASVSLDVSDTRADVSGAWCLSLLESNSLLLRFLGPGVAMLMLFGLIRIWAMMCLGIEARG